MIAIVSCAGGMVEYRIEATADGKRQVSVWAAPMDVEQFEEQGDPLLFETFADAMDWIASRIEGKPPVAVVEEPRPMPEPRPIEKVRYNQEFRFLHGDEIWCLVDRRPSRDVKSGRPLQIQKRNGATAEVAWGTIVVPLTN